MSGPDLAIFTVKITFALLAVILILFFLVRPLLRTLRARPDFLDTLQTVQMPIEEDEELQIPSEDSKPDRSAMVQHARSDPAKAALLVSQWLKEKK